MPKYIKQISVIMAFAALVGASFAAPGSAFAQSKTDRIRQDSAPGKSDRDRNEAAPAEKRDPGARFNQPNKTNNDRNEQRAPAKTQKRR